MRTGTREEWLTERISLLEREKELTRRSDELASARRDLPWVPIYVRLLWGVARAEVRNLRLHPSGVHRLSGVSLDGIPGVQP